MIIFLTGTPCTGKGAIAKELQKLGFKWIEINKIVEEKKLWEKIEEGAKVANIKKLQEEMEKIIREVKRKNENVVIEGHLVCELILTGDLGIVLRTNPKVLEMRLRRRGYIKDKIRGNVECEIIDYCTQLAEKNWKCKLYEVNSSGSSRDTIKSIKRILSGKGEKFRVGWVNWTQISF